MLATLRAAPHTRSKCWAQALSRYPEDGGLSRYRRSASKHEIIAVGYHNSGESSFYGRVLMGSCLRRWIPGRHRLGESKIASDSGRRETIN